MIESPPSSAGFWRICKTWWDSSYQSNNSSNRSTNPLQQPVTPRDLPETTSPEQRIANWEFFCFPNSCKTFHSLTCSSKNTHTGTISGCGFSGSLLAPPRAICFASVPTGEDCLKNCSTFGYTKSSRLGSCSSSFSSSSWVKTLTKTMCARRWSPTPTGMSICEVSSAPWWLPSTTSTTTVEL